MSIKSFQVMALTMRMEEALEELKKVGLTPKERSNIDGQISLLNRMADESDLEFIPGTAEVRVKQ